MYIGAQSSSFPPPSAEEVAATAVAAAAARRDDQAQLAKCLIPLASALVAAGDDEDASHTLGKTRYIYIYICWYRN